ncbi:S-adenosyl-L-methionine-dependent methyltransferase [Mycena maculata]|uniref:S-adenosyl-L-methionine-dependent methyltransferase n=1 Tax=Mycena maculata TaxID=230809 RepID=A0AAD7KKC1_9AGAR|nr:S-adenosyl-L-methionine-dependent methyltransferase [Mycena maculata]
MSSTLAPNEAHAPRDRGSYFLPTAHESRDEMQRLDDTHEAFRQYFGGSLCFAPLAQEEPRKILELGCGSGAWAIQAAKQFPNAHVLAVDVAPLPDRIIPTNMKFRLVDLSRPSDLETETFDIVHARMVMTHVSHGREALLRAARFVKPGGLLLMEDIDLRSLAESGGPAVFRYISKMIEAWGTRGADTELGRKMEGILRTLEFFPDVHAERIAMPFAGTSADKAMNELGVALRKSWLQAAEKAGSRLAGYGVTEEMIREHNEELGRRDSSAMMVMYFCWARRSLF